MDPITMNGFRTYTKRQAICLFVVIYENSLIDQVCILKAQTLRGFLGRKGQKPDTLSCCEHRIGKSRIAGSMGKKIQMSPGCGK